MKIYTDPKTKCQHLKTDDDFFESPEVQIKEAVQNLKDLLYETQGIYIIGNIDDKYTISHLCGNHMYTDLPCINPYHCYFATREEQSMDILKTDKSKKPIQ